MRPEKPATPDANEPRKTGINYLRLALILIVGLTLISVIAILIIFLRADSNGSMKDVNVNITVRSPTPYIPDKPILPRPPPQPPLPKVGQQPRYSTPVPPTSPTPDQNTNEQVTPKPTSRSSPSESPP